METINLLTAFLLRILPGLALVAAVLAIVRPKREYRILIYIAAFVLMRDAMTPLGLWSLGSERGFLWIRLIDNTGFLVAFGLGSLSLVAALAFLDKENRKALVWFRSGKVSGVLMGFLGAALVVLPFVIAYRFIGSSARGGDVARSLLPGLLVFTLLGNLLEEVLFRGYLLSLIPEKYSDISRGALTGLFFAFFHIYLATTVTAVGAPLLLFTIWEGILVGIIGARRGILPATAAHGTAIFLLASGLF